MPSMAVPAFRAWAAYTRLPMNRVPYAGGSSRAKETKVTAAASRFRFAGAASSRASSSWTATALALSSAPTVPATES